LDGSGHIVSHGDLHDFLTLDVAPQDLRAVEHVPHALAVVVQGDFMSGLHLFQLRCDLSAQRGNLPGTEDVHGHLVRGASVCVCVGVLWHICPLRDDLMRPAVRLPCLDGAAGQCKAESADSPAAQKRL
jgi:hypothetical protein